MKKTELESIASFIGGLLVSFAILIVVLSFFSPAPRDSSSVQSVARRLLNASVIVTSGAGQGSGTVISVAGPYAYILTAGHVVDTKPPTKLAVVSRRYGWVLPARIVYNDPNRDIAILQVPRPPMASFTAIPICQSLPTLGETVYNVGAPSGAGPVFGEGIVSETRVQLSLGDGTITPPGFFYTDGTSFGDSGGGVFRLDPVCVAGVMDRVAAILGAPIYFMGYASDATHTPRVF